MPVAERRRLANLITGPDLAPDEWMRGRTIEPEPDLPQPPERDKQARLF